MKKNIMILFLLFLIPISFANTNQIEQTYLNNINISFTNICDNLNGKIKENEYCFLNENLNLRLKSFYFDKNILSKVKNITKQSQFYENMKIISVEELGNNNYQILFYDNNNLYYAGIRNGYFNSVDEIKDINYNCSDISYIKENGIVQIYPKCLYKNKKDFTLLSNVNDLEQIKIFSVYNKYETNESILSMIKGFNQTLKVSNISQKYQFVELSNRWINTSKKFESGNLTKEEFFNEFNIFKFKLKEEIIKLKLKYNKENLINYINSKYIDEKNYNVSEEMIKELNTLYNKNKIDFVNSNFKEINNLPEEIYNKSIEEINPKNNIETQNYLISFKNLLKDLI